MGARGPSVYLLLSRLFDCWRYQLACLSASVTLMG